MLDRSKAVLVIVDVQGKLAQLMHEKEIFFANVNRMIKAAKLLDIPIIWNEQLPNKLGETTPEAKDQLEGHNPLIKSSFSCCGNTDFNSALAESGRKQVLLTGMETHICVYQTARDLLRDGYEVHLISDAISSRIATNKTVGIEAMRELGAKLSSVEMALFEMFNVAEGDDFRELVKIVK